MADVIIGQPFAPTIQVNSPAGSPVTSGVTGTMSLYYANGSSASAVASGSLAHQGQGRWGFPFTGANLASAGLHYARVPSVTGGATLSNQEIAFLVGELAPEEATLRDLLVHIVTELGDGFASAATSLGTTTTLVDTYLSDGGAASNEWLGAELVLLAPGAATDAPVAKVTGFSGSTLTFTPAVNAAVPSGAEYLLIHRRGAGKGYRQVMRAIQAAARRNRPQQYATDEVSLTTSSASYELAVPRGWRRVTKLWIDRSAGTIREWREVAPAYWRWEGDQRVIRLDRLHAGNLPVRIGGYLDRLEPRLLSSVVGAAWPLVADEVAGELGLGKRDRATLQVQRGRAQRPRR